MSRLKRNFERQRAQSEMEKGVITDPLSLPFMKILQEIHSLRLAEAFRILVTCGACTLTAGKQEELYLDTIRGLKRSDLEKIQRAWGQLILDMEDRPFRDLLGPAYMEVGHQLDKSARGEFFTPHSLNYLLAAMNLGDNPREVFPKGRVLECNEPSCGSGGMILAFAEVLVDKGISPMHTRWVAQDISSLSCYATVINTTFWGIPTRVVCGNTLIPETRWTWDNLHWPQATPLPEEVPSEFGGRLVEVMQKLRALMTEEPSAREAEQPQPAPIKPSQPKPAAPFGAEFGPLFGGEG